MMWLISAYDQLRPQCWQKIDNLCIGRIACTIKQAINGMCECSKLAIYMLVTNKGTCHKSEIVKSSLQHIDPSEPVDKRCISDLGNILISLW